MIARRIQQQRGGVRADAVQGEQARGAVTDQGDDELVQALEDQLFAGIPGDLHIQRRSFALRKPWSCSAGWSSPCAR